jgi:hypothetical protein
MTEPVLTEGDRHNATWLRLEKHLKERLENLRAHNDADLSEARTARLRGRIKEVQYLLSLGTDKPVMQSEDALFKD